MLPATCPSAASSMATAKFDTRGIPELRKHIKKYQDTCTKGSSRDDDDRKLEAIALRRGIGDLEAKIGRMTVTHYSHMSNLKHKLADSANAMQQGMSSLTEKWLCRQIA